MAEIITTTTTKRPCLKYKFVKRRPLTMGEEVCIDKKTFCQDVSLSVWTPVRPIQEEPEANLLSSSKVGTDILIVRH